MLTKEVLNDLYWNKKYSISKIAVLTNLSGVSIYKKLRKYDIPRRTISESKFKKGHKINSRLTLEEEKLKIAGVMLYWAEGTKTGNRIDFANSDPSMIKIFLKFLREICHIDEKRLRAYLYMYESLDIEQLKKYWVNLTEIPLKQFSKPYIKTNNLNLSQRKMSYGLVHIRYSDKKLFDLMQMWIKEYQEHDWAGGRAVNGIRL